MRDTEREAETQAEGKQAPCKEPDVGLHPGTPESRLEPKAGAQPLSHPGVPLLHFLNSLFGRVKIVEFASLKGCHSASLHQTQFPGKYKSHQADGGTG